MVMNRLSLFIVSLLAVCSACLSGCSIGGLTSWRATATQPSQPTSSVEPTTTVQKELTICLGEEPESLYLYAAKQSEAMWSVLEGIYDGPFDRSNGRYLAVILQKVPTYEDGDLIRSAVSVMSGDLVVDANNQIVALATGNVVLPTGCTDNSCAITWDGTSELQMDQVTAQFKLRANLLWSDGSPLTTADSKFSFKVNGDPASHSGDRKLELTQSYEVIDDITLQWKGIPGYLGIESQAMFWTPLPSHLLESVPVSDLAGTELAARRPVGWGPYVITEWISGESISMQKNPFYFRAKEGLPGIDRIIYRFINPKSGGSLAALAAGQCDLIERSSNPEADLNLVTDLLNSTNTNVVWSEAPEVTQLVIGIKPADHDDGYNPAHDRLDYFREPATRQALAACIDREAMNTELYAGRAVPASIADLLGNQASTAGQASLEYDRATAEELLDRSGWVDTDDDPNTPRLAENVPGVPVNTPLSLELLVPTDSGSRAIASGIAASLTECGIQVMTQAVPFSELYAPGPDGMIFGRSFDLALINWQYSLAPACYLYTNVQIPASGNYWIGGNVSGYSRTEFDVACSGMQQTIPGDGDYENYLQKAVEYFQMDLPAIPLFKQPRLVLARQDLCNFTYNAFARSDLAALELFDLSPDCKSQ
jgi:peptide/nickel transport system substrate-binding protein